MAKYTIKQAMWITQLKELYDKPFETDNFNEFCEKLYKNFSEHGKGRVTAIKKIVGNETDGYYVELYNYISKDKNAE